LKAVLAVRNAFSQGARSEPQYEIRLIGCTEVEELRQMSAAVQNHSFPAHSEIYRESRALPPLFLEFLTAGNNALAV